MKSFKQLMNEVAAPVSQSDTEMMAAHPIRVFDPVGYGKNLPRAQKAPARLADPKPNGSLDRARVASSVAREQPVKAPAKGDGDGDEFQISAAEDEDEAHTVDAENPLSYAIPEAFQALFFEEVPAAAMQDDLSSLWARHAGYAAAKNSSAAANAKKIYDLVKGKHGKEVADAMKAHSTCKELGLNAMCSQLRKQHLHEREAEKDPAVGRPKLDELSNLWHVYARNHASEPYTKGLDDHNKNIYDYVYRKYGKETADDMHTHAHNMFSGHVHELRAKHGIMEDEEESINESRFRADFMAPKKGISKLSTDVRSGNDPEGLGNYYDVKTGLNHHTLHRENGRFIVQKGGEPGGYEFSSHGSLVGAVGMLRHHGHNVMSTSFDRKHLMDEEVALHHDKSIQEHAAPQFFSNGGFVVHGITHLSNHKHGISAWYHPDGTLSDAEGIDARRRSHNIPPDGAVTAGLKELGQHIVKNKHQYTNAVKEEIEPKNKKYGFVGALGEKAESYLDRAAAAVRKATGWNDEKINHYLDSSHGKSLGEALLNNHSPAKIARSLRHNTNIFDSTYNPAYFNPVGEEYLEERSTLPGLADWANAEGHHELRSPDGSGYSISKSGERHVLTFWHKNGSAKPFTHLGRFDSVEKAYKAARRHEGKLHEAEIPEGDPRNYHKEMAQHHYEEKNKVMSKMMEDPAFRQAHHEFVHTHGNAPEFNDKYEAFIKARDAHPLSKKFQHHEREFYHHQKMAEEHLHEETAAGVPVPGAVSDEGALKYVKKVGGKWALVSRHTGRPLKYFGGKPSREEAGKALQHVEYFKHGGNLKEDTDDQLDAVITMHGNDHDCTYSVEHQKATRYEEVQLDEVFSNDAHSTKLHQLLNSHEGLKKMFGPSPDMFVAGRLTTPHGGSEFHIMGKKHIAHQIIARPREGQSEKDRLYKTHFTDTNGKLLSQVSHVSSDPHHSMIAAYDELKRRGLHEAENLNELSQDTLASYVSKGIRNAQIHKNLSHQFDSDADRADKEGQHGKAGRLHDRAGRHYHKFLNRKKGITKAAGAVYGEQAEIDKDTRRGLLATIDYHTGKENHHRQSAEVAHRQARKHDLTGSKYKALKAIAKDHETCAAHHALCIADLKKQYIDAINEEPLEESTGGRPRRKTGGYWGHCDVKPHRFLGKDISELETHLNNIKKRNGYAELRKAHGESDTYPERHRTELMPASDHTHFTLSHPDKNKEDLFVSHKHGKIHRIGHHSTINLGQHEIHFGKERQVWKNGKKREVWHDIENGHLALTRFDEEQLELDEAKSIHMKVRYNDREAWARDSGSLGYRTHLNPANTDHVIHQYDMESRKNGKVMGYWSHAENRGYLKMKPIKEEQLDELSPETNAIKRIRGIRKATGKLAQKANNKKA